MATQKVNKFREININDDFRQYAWVLESYDVKAAFNDFLRIEQGIQTKDNEDILNELYKQFLETKSSDHMTQLQFDVLNYILKYESGVYKKGEVIADIVEPKDGTFTINEPGYYYIEVTGNAGNSSGVFKNYLSDGSAVTTLENEDTKLHIRNDLKFNLITGTGNNIKRVGGYVELNKKYAFFYSVTYDFDKSIDYSNYETGFSDIIEKGLENASFYDYAKFEDDIFNKNFFSITFIENGISLHRLIKLDYKNYTCGLSDDEIKSALNEIDKDKCKYYYNIIDKNIRQSNCKTLGYSSVIETDNASRDSILHQNELHGGDGGFINSVIKITKPLTLSYSLSTKDSNKKNSLTCDFFEMIAEAGGSLTSTSNKYEFNDVDDYAELSLNDSIDGHKFLNQVDLTTKFDSHIGESIDHDVLCGCGRGIYKDSNGVVQHVFYGGGAYGEGIRLNEFGTAYYQEKDIGHIRIKYLGSQYCKTQAFNYDSEHKEDISLYTNEKIPVSDNIDIKLNLRKLYGCFDKNDIKEIIEPVSRHLNYIDAKLITKNVTDKTYIFKHNDNQYVSFEPLTEEYSYVNDDNTNECKFNNILFGTGKELTVSTIMKNNSECFDLKFIYAYNFVINPSLNMIIDSFKNSKLTINYSNICTNIKIFKKYSEILSISFLLKNTLSLPEIIDSFGDVTHIKDLNARIESIEYRTDYGNESSLLSYADGQTIYVSKGTTFYIKFNFSSPRIVIDENASSFSGKVSYTKKNLELDGQNILDRYFDPSNGINFQYVIFSPSFSQDVSVFIKKYVFTFKIIQDLYRNLVINNVSLKNEFEVGECCEISFNLKNYERISHLRAETDKDKTTYLVSSTNFTDQYYVPNYAYTESTDNGKSNHIFESFIAFYDENELDSKLYNFCDKRINNMLNRKGCLGKNKDNAQGEKGLFVLASRDVNKKCYTDNFVSSFGPQINIIAINNNKNLINELITIRLYFKESNIKLRLSSDYCNGEEVFTYENGESGIVSFFKPYSFVIEIVGGPTGNGENASLEKAKSWKAATMGFFGGDGYIGGNGGCSGDTTYWGPSKSGWHFAITDLHLNCAWGIEKAYGGRGFMKCGGIGSEGKNLLTHNQQFLFGESEKPQPWTDKCNWYTGIPIVRELSIYKTIEDFKPITFYFKAGIQGLNLINSTGDGRGGGGGLPSFITAISNCSFFEINRDIVDSGNHRFGSYGKSQFTTNKPKTGLVVEGGIPGATRGVDTQKVEYSDHIWSLSDMFHIAHYDQCGQHQYFHPYSWVNGHKEKNISSYEMLYRVNNADKKIGYERLLNNKMGDENKPLFSSTGYSKAYGTESFQQKFKSLSSFDKNYMFLVKKDDSGKYTFNDNTIAITNTEADFSISANNHTQENNISNRFLTDDNFIGKAFYSYESGIIRLTVQNNLKIDKSITYKNANKINYDSFIKGECEALFMAPYYSNELSEEELLKQARTQKISDKVEELRSVLMSLNNDINAILILGQMNNELKEKGDKWFIDFYEKSRETFKTYNVEYDLDKS